MSFRVSTREEEKVKDDDRRKPPDLFSSVTGVSAGPFIDRRNGGGPLEDVGRPTTRLVDYGEVREGGVRGRGDTSLLYPSTTKNKDFPL